MEQPCFTDRLLRARRLVCKHQVASSGVGTSSSARVPDEKRRCYASRFSIDTETDRRRRSDVGFARVHLENTEFEAQHPGEPSREQHRWIRAPAFDLTDVLGMNAAERRDGVTGEAERLPPAPDSCAEFDEIRGLRDRRTNRHDSSTGAPNRFVISEISRTFLGGVKSPTCSDISRGATEMRYL